MRTALSFVPSFPALSRRLLVCALLLVGGVQASESDRRAEVVDTKADARAETKPDKVEGKPERTDKGDTRAESRAPSRSEARSKTAARPVSVKAAASPVPAATPVAVAAGAADVRDTRDGKVVPGTMTSAAATPRSEPIAPVAQAFPLAGGEHGDAGHWTYDGDHGPAAWAELAPEFSACANGTRQSPIDLREGIKVDLEPITFDYRESSFKVIDNGHTVQVNVAPGNAIRVMGRRFNLVQLHFHRPSEELIDGHAAEMVVHLEHRDADGKLAVVAVLLENGKPQPEVQAVWNNLPLEKNEEMPASGRMDLLHLLPEDRRYYTYMGSLTTPPCTEGVLWMVMKQPVTVSAAQIALFARLYPLNARPVQATSGRMIKESN